MNADRNDIIGFGFFRNQRDIMSRNYSVFEETEIRSEYKGRRAKRPFKEDGNSDDGRIDYTIFHSDYINGVYRRKQENYSGFICDAWIWSDWLSG